MTPWALLAVALTSVLAHAAVIATAKFDMTKSVNSLDEAEELAAVDLKFSCWSDAGLALAATTLGCSLPGLASQDCEALAWENYRFDVILCDGLQDDPSGQEAVAFMSAEEIDSIEALPLLDVEELEELQVAQLLEEELQEKIDEAQEKISDPRQSGQVIEVTAPDVESTPDKARYLSEFDTQVEKEMVARGSTEKMIAKPSPEELPIDEQPQELPEDPQPSGEESQNEALVAKTTDGSDADGSSVKSAPVLAMRAQEARSAATVGELSGADALEANGLAAAKGDGSRAQNAQKAQEGREAVNAGAGARSTLPNLRPSEETLSRVAGGGSVDKLDGIESGDFTAINSKKWKFASFFNRMKRQVAQNWHPDVVYVRRDPTGKVYGTKDRITVLEVSLKSDGSLAKVVVFQESGVDFLDAEAISAFELAQPFPNPPAGLVDSGSQLITFSFGFHFQVGSRPDSWQIFRYN